MYHEPGKEQSQDLNKSTQDFLNIVWPRLQLVSGFEKAKLINLETEKSELARVLDIEAGIDFLIYIEGKGCKGISNRIQWCTKPWGTFTIRSSRPGSGFETELEKKQRSSSIGYMNAGLTIQSYLHPETKEILAIGIIATERLHECIKKRPELVQTKTNKDNSSDFVYIRWSDIIAAGYQVLVIGDRQ